MCHQKFRNFLERNFYFLECEEELLDEDQIESVGSPPEHHKYWSKKSSPQRDHLRISLPPPPEDKNLLNPYSPPSPSVSVYFLRVGITEIFFS